VGSWSLGIAEWSHRAASAYYSGCDYEAWLLFSLADGIAKRDSEEVGVEEEEEKG